MVQCLRICLPVQGTQVLSLVRKESAYRHLLPLKSPQLMSAHSKENPEQPLINSFIFKKDLHTVLARIKED